MSSSRKERLQDRIRETLDRLRGKPGNPPKNAKVDSSANAQEELSTLAISPDPGFQRTTPSASSTTLDQICDAPKVSSTSKDDATKSGIDRSTVIPVAHTSGPEQESSIDNSAACVDGEMTIASSDLWSAAYREAVDSLDQDLDAAILQGKNVAELFKQLEEIDKEKTQESAFLRGVRYLHSLQVPLETFKLALDIATPLTSMQPVASMALGVVRGVTAIAISFSTADMEFAKQIGELLQQLSYIDECDALGQRTETPNIHKALVLVYQKLLEFYNAAFEILSRKGAKLVMKMVLETDRLPNIVKDFLKHADYLHKLVVNATSNIVADIKKMLLDYEIARWLGAEKMSRQSQHHANQQDIRANQACEYLLSDIEFINWNQAAKSQQLVVLGNMGFGKTVAMAFLIDELRRQNKHTLFRPKVCYHYCQDDETGKAVYVFSALILSFLEQFAGLKKPFFEWYKQALASGIDPATSFKKLEEWFLGTVKTLDRPLVLVIDGLDECDRASRNTLLRSLRNVSENAPRLKILLSSRPQEEILQQLIGMAKITLGADSQRDRIIVEKAIERQLCHLREEVKTFITDTLSSKAQGSAIWVKMTVDLIERQKIRASSPMQVFLGQLPLPTQLSELYANLFSRCTENDPENERLAAAALEILAISRRPLSIMELAWAVALGSAQEAVLTVDALDKLVDHLRVMDLIQPFVVHVDFRDVRKRQVRLVHQSVKDFIIRDLASIRRDQRSSAVPTSVFANSAAVQQHNQQQIIKLEAYMLNVCIQYLLLNDLGYIKLFSEEHVAIEELPQDVDLFGDSEESNDYDPYCTWEAWEANMIRYDPIERGFGELFVYAACHWIEHFGAVCDESLLPDPRSIENLCQVGSTRLHNWITQNCRPDCTIKSRFLFDSSLYDPLSITSLYGSETMLQKMLESSDFDGDQFLPNTAMGAADQILQWGDLSRLKLLFKSKIGQHLRNFEFFGLIIKQWSNSPSDKYRESWDVVFDLIDHMLDIMIRDRWGNKFLCMAASKNCIPVIRRLTDRAQQMAELKAELLNGPQPEPRLIGESVWRSHLGIVE